LTIETKNIAFDTRVQFGATAGPYVLLAVSDMGVGMDAEVKRHLFEPFFTTKGVGKGTGLGLAMCYGIVKQHDGHIVVESDVGCGTTVRIYLPRVQARLADQAVIDTAGAPPLVQGAETILLVEDEGTVRSLAARILRACGYTVLESSNGVDALRMAQAYSAPLDLLLTDVVMPHMSGMTLAAQLTHVRPGLKVLFSSGYVDSASIAHGQISPGSNLLQKPFTAAVLARKVREVLDAKGAESRTELKVES